VRPKDTVAPVAPGPARCHAVASGIDAGLDEQALEPEVDSRAPRRSEAFTAATSPRFSVDVGAEHEQPVHALRERRENLRAAPILERH
jgi:hypothetical protein